MTTNTTIWGSLWSINIENWLINIPAPTNDESYQSDWHESWLIMTTEHAQSKMFDQSIAITHAHISPVNRTKITDLRIDVITSTSIRGF